MCTRQGISARMEDAGTWEFGGDLLAVELDPAIGRPRHDTQLARLQGRAVDGPQDLDALVPEGARRKSQQRREASHRRIRQM